MTDRDKLNEELLELAEKVAQQLNEEPTETVEEWAERLSKKLSQLTD